ncbi:MAG: hypothetical protein QF437_12555 [Planctomycetota bacterium]|jgi:hypothetical protein|nr:hypothetical protein [Planctomycetota bacterium]MDP7131317.1 hypothetical protein [Planctomycetota bacterium]MDP7250290.1 hypothetical protein [Planctomycetota bacterium]
MTVRLLVVFILLAHAMVRAEVKESLTYIPPGLAGRVVFYHSFEDGTRPEVNELGAKVLGMKSEPVPGLAGKGRRMPPGSGKDPYRLVSPSLSPDRPLTISMWWRLDKPMKPETCFHLVTLRGKGIVANFVRGKGTWCALKEPTFVFQVYYWGDIRNHNNPWAGTAWFEPQEWHHVAMTFANASEIRTYWDGKLRSSHAIKGRQFRKGDGGQVDLGSSWLFHPMTIDEVMVLDRALAADEVKDYVTTVRKLAEIRFPWK